MKRHCLLDISQEESKFHTASAILGEIQTTDVLYKQKRDSPATSHVTKAQASEPENDENSNEKIVNAEKPTIEQPTSIEEK
ncbi:hypothetical protein OESDEN_03839 [Oesophagostomum dentatum]|uniref:Uncharacterized protein n=1 Tax=Oesophagostomum dentatum TaxID=61180 RepID=A0A0B1TLD9_OESDE|nr:hypothetical protein OESDEN_03839 [Oesophagostomum dentatum]